ncbi:MAG: GNAT family N-acetyltransferase [Novosphingobium sp.]|nr:GNAT family N-acetyltransferase [Novosphingobium sp.]
MIEPALVRLFATGWCVTRGVAPPVAEGPALRIEVGLADETRRYVFPAPPEGISAVAESVTEPRVLLKAPLAEENVRDLLPPHWHVEQTGTMMTLAALPVAMGAVAADAVTAGFALDLADDGKMVTASIIAADGSLAASGKLVVVDQWALHDRIRVAEAHRRLGLGRAVMLALGAEARRRGAARGLLAATMMGRALYQTLGWEDRAPWVTAQIKP